MYPGNHYSFIPPTLVNENIYTYPLVYQQSPTVPTMVIHPPSKKKEKMPLKKQKRKRKKFFFLNKLSME